MTASLHSAHAALDAAQAHALLASAASAKQRAAALTDCFFDGSHAAAQLAAHAILRSLSESDLDHLTDTLRSLPTAVPFRNADPLARVAAVLVTQSGSRHAAPINTFCFADPSVRRVALRALLHQLARLDSALADALHASKTFFSHILAPASDLADRLLAVSGLVDVARRLPSVRDVVISFLLDLSSASGGVLSEEDDYDQVEFFSFLFSSLVSIACDNTSFSLVLRYALLHAFERANPDILSSLWKSPLCATAIPLIGADVTLHVLVTIATACAFRGSLTLCSNALSLATLTISSMPQSHRVVHPVILATITANCVSIASMCSAVDVAEIARTATQIPGLVTESTNSATTDNVNKLYQSACDIRCSRTALMLGLLEKAAHLWQDAAKLTSWLREDYATMFYDDQSTSQTSHRSMFQAGYDDDQDTQEDVSPPSPPILYYTSVAMACLSHPHSRVRLCIVSTLTKLSSCPVLLFYFPVILKRLEVERNGYVAAEVLRDLLPSPALLADRETSRIVLRALLGLMETADIAQTSGTKEVGLVALAGSACIAPSITNVLLSEVEKLTRSFEHIPSSLKAAACAAIAKLVSVRPARGTQFVPFISKCIDVKSVADAPEACAMCFRAMSDMADEQVLDATKAVKIVLKAFPSVDNVPSVARKSYFQVLGTVCSAAEGKKGRVVARKAISVLRYYLVESEISVKNEQLVHVSQAAESLARFTADDILRITHEADPLDDYEAEQARLEGIEESCATFITALVVLAADLRDVPLTALEQLLLKLVSAEWEKARRGKLDVDVGRLRATAEKLRRVRQGGDENAVESFNRAVQTLPTGVMKAICTLCSSIEGGNMHRSVVALQTLAKARAMPRSLSWVPLLNEIIQIGGLELKRAALAALCWTDVGAGTDDARAQWFSTCEMLDALQPLFVGTVLFYPQNISIVLERAAGVAAENGDVLKELVNGLSDVMATRHGEAAASAVLEFMSDRQFTKDVEEAFANVLRNATERVRILGPREASPENISRMSAKLSCLVGDEQLVRMHAMALISSKIDVERRESLAETIGRTARTLPAVARQELVHDIVEQCGSASGQSDSIQGIILAHAVGVGALLPGTSRALACLPAIENGANMYGTILNN